MLKMDVLLSKTIFLAIIEMIDSPKVSVIVPVFNAAESLEKSIDSLLKQTLNDLEIVIINDASTDNSRTLIDNLAKENKQIVAVHFNENKGVHEARLAGLRVAAGDWIGFLDADDFARPRMFQTMFNEATRRKVDIVICGSFRVTQERKMISTKLVFKHAEKVDSKVFEKFCRFEFGTGMLWNKLYARDLIVPYADMHFPWRQNINEDLLLNIGCFHDAGSIFLSNEVLHEYVYSGQSVTSTVDNAKAYVNTYRAFALAVHFYYILGSDSFDKVIEMYRVQFSWSDYSIDDLSKIATYKNELEEASYLIFSSYPMAFPLLSARKEPAKVSAKNAMRILVKKVLSSLGIKANNLK